MGVPQIVTVVIAAGRDRPTGAGTPSVSVCYNYERDNLSYSHTLTREDPKCMCTASVLPDVSACKQRESLHVMLSCLSTRE